MAGTEELEKHLRGHFEKAECSFLDEWSGGLSTLTSPQCFEAIIRFLWIIKPSLKQSLSSHLLPPSATARFRVATNAVEALKEVGVRERIGFQNLLYGNGKDLSGVFIELVRLIPIEGDIDHIEEISFYDDLLNRSRSIISPDSLWVPEFCRLLKLKHDGRYWCPNENESELYDLSSVRRSLQSIIDCPNERRELAAALLSIEMEHDDIPQPIEKPPLLAKPTLPPKPSLKPTSLTSPTLIEDKVSEEDEEKKREREEMERLLDEAMSTLRVTEDQYEQLSQSERSLDNELFSYTNELERFDDKLMVVLEDPEAAKAKIEKFLNDRDDRVHALETRWEGMKREKMDELNRLREQTKNTASTMTISERIHRLREEIAHLKQTKEVYARREEKLSKRVERMDDSTSTRINRHSYVKKLFDVTNNIKKQREEMQKVWKITDGIMKDIKWTEQAATRTFDLLEDILYKEIDRSPKDERLYKNFVTMFNQCQLIIRTIENIGHSKQRKEQLIDKVDIASQGSFDSHLEPMMEDLIAIQEENARLEEILKQT